MKINNLTADKLRKSILQLAIQGKLVKQNPDDEPASELVKKIYAEKQKLIAEGKIKKDKTESYIYKGDDNRYYEKIGKNEPVDITDDLPFDIPDSWEWIRLKTFTFLNGGYAFKSEKFSINGIRVIRISDFDESGLKHKDIKRYPYSKDLEQYKINNDDILMCMTGGTVGKSVLIKEIQEDSYINQRVALIRAFLTNIKFIDCIIKSPYLSNIVKSSKTSTNDNISMKTIEDFFIPLPPLAEQQRIVEKIESMEPYLAQYDKIEKQLTKLEGEIKDKLKKSILQYAIQGKLVKQDPNDEPASVLLERIKAEKEQLIKEGKIKRDKNESFIYKGDDKNYYENINGKVVNITEEIPFEIPDNWCWNKLKNISFITKLAGFEFTKYISPNLQMQGIPLFKGKNVQNNNIVYKFESFIPPEISNLLKRSQVYKKCLLTPYVGTIGNVAIHDKEGLFHLGSNVGKIELYNNKNVNILEEYVLYYLKSNTGYLELSKLKKATAQESISIDAIRETFVPLPPKEEQNIIVESIKNIEQIIG